MKVNDQGELVLHQSDLSHFGSCPDQFRIVNGIQPGGTFEKDPLARMETDAATVGTVTHAVIEHEMTKGRFPNLAAAERWAKDHMGNLVFGYVTDGFEYRTETFGDDPTKSLAALCSLVSAWWHSEERAYWLALKAKHPTKIVNEWSFEVPFITGRTGLYKNIRLAGTADVLDTHNHRLVDWKTSGSAYGYKRWEKQRWAVQPTVYTFAAASLGLIERHEQFGYQFDYRIFTYKGSDPQPTPLTVWRDTGQWGALTQQVSNMVDMIESDLASWPLANESFLCSPKWCPVWSKCRGLFLDESWT